MYKFEVWDLKGWMYIFFPKEWYRGYSLTFCCSVWSQPCGCCFTWGLYMKLIFMSLFIEQYTCRYTSPTPSDHSGFEDVVVAYCSWSLTRYWAMTRLFWEELRTHSYFWKRIISCNFKYTSNFVHPIYLQERQWSGHASSVSLQMMNILISFIWIAGWRNKCGEDLHSWIQIEYCRIEWNGME